jgi:hypothetical protein
VGAVDVIVASDAMDDDEADVVADISEVDDFMAEGKEAAKQSLDLALCCSETRPRRKSSCMLVDERGGRIV